MSGKSQSHTFSAVVLLPLLLIVMLLLPLSSARASGWTVDLVTEEATGLATKLVKGIDNRISQRDDVNQYSPNASHHVRILINTHTVAGEGDDSGISLSLSTVLMIKQQASGRFVPLLIDSAAGFCTAATLEVCVRSVMAGLDSALDYSNKASSLIASLSRSQ